MDFFIENDIIYQIIERYFNKNKLMLDSIADVVSFVEDTEFDNETCLSVHAKVPEQIKKINAVTKIMNDWAYDKGVAQLMF